MIFVLTFLDIVQLRGHPIDDDIKELIRTRILGKHCKCSMLDSKKVIIEGKETSIREYFNGSEEGKTKDAITSGNVYDVSHITNIQIYIQIYITYHKRFIMK